MSSGAIPPELLGPHLRLCARVDELKEPAVPSELRRCIRCSAEVWYDPKASINPPTEIVMCGECFETVGRPDEGKTPC